ncbi:TWiK family of potassium channels protein 7 isoform X2 [Contarinia nasturtii]|uniref:TWiK family of potassium channels protein 7 isoform X2 n=1 Tax=Contarinia nasturtii TaxID=265458 RepID=UPI0012D4A649|nr:TWiK family of potassium channels protein 7 isoform X2 [Contarinia nasturtii]
MDEMAHNKDEEADEELLGQLKVFDEIKKRSTFRHRLCSWWKSLKLRSAFGHIGLMISLSIYCVVGGVIFRSLEAPAEEDRAHKLHTNVIMERDYLIGNLTSLANMTDLRNRNLNRVITYHLEKYERVAQDAVQGGVTLGSNETLPYTQKWTIVQAIFFSSTILTTIGYGNLYPTTTSGRGFCMLFALIGIPFTLTVIADLGRVFATAVSALGKKLPSLTIDTDSTSSDKKWLYALASVFFLGFYLACGALMLQMWEEKWGFFEGFYFCFITMTTIGLGDLVPQKADYMLLCTLYILLGLALTSTIIELVRRQYNESWKKIQEMSLADTLRRMQLGGDVSALQNDIKRILTVSRRGAISDKGRDDVDDQEIAALAGVIMEEVKKSQIKNKHNIIQIVIYESSV